MKVNIMNNGNSVKLFVAILAGGSGTRLWPLSPPACPKPFVPLGPLGSLYGGTVARAQALGAERVFTVGSGALKHHCEMTGVEFLEEPGARNTAPAIALAGARAWREAGGEGLLLVLPADHHIPEVEPFAQTLERLARVALAENALGVMGMSPTGPEVSYGYIEQGPPVGEGFRVARFIEKPDKAKAEALLLQGNVAWNSGMFLYPLEVLREEMALHAPGLWEAADAWLDAKDSAPYLGARSISVDYALMEKSSRVVLVPGRFAWSDVGTFQALHEFLPKDAEGNAGWGPGRIEGCSGCLVVTHSPRTLVRGLNGMAVIDTADGLLTTPLQGSDGIRSGVEAVLRHS
jgi:mannose-1-phosphate guanylyltransferase/mannose-6-phosphate isomerase